jgi:hypothetical protein
MPAWNGLLISIGRVVRDAFSDVSGKVITVTAGGQATEQLPTTTGGGICTDRSPSPVTCARQEAMMGISARRWRML